MLASSYQGTLSKLLDELECHVVLPEEWAECYFDEAGVEPTSYHERRQHARFRMRTKAILEIEESFPAIPRTSEKALVYTCDVGRGGLGFLHTDQLYPGEICTVWLATRKMRVVVTRCRYHNPMCFQVGVKPL